MNAMAANVDVGAEVSVAETLGVEKRHFGCGGGFVGSFVGKFFYNEDC